MKRSALLLATAATALWMAPASAQTVEAPVAVDPTPGVDTLQEALVRAYNTNPSLTAERANLRAVDEGVPIARSAGLPSVSANGGYTENVLSASNSFVSPDRQLTAGANLTVPIYRGGGVRNSVRAAESRIDAGRANLRSVESQTFTGVVAAYMDVIRDEATVGLNRQNVRALEVNLQATKDRFEVGDLTRTDVAQSEARLATARAQLQSAEARLINSREVYIRVVGTPPGELAPPPPLPNLPDDPNTAVRVALDANPTLEAAQANRDASAFDVRVAQASRLPQLSATTGGNYYNYLGSLGSATGAAVQQSGTAATVGLTLSIPLFQGGRPAAQVRQARARQSAAIEGVTSAERAVVQQTRSAYASWQASLQVVRSAETAVAANRLALEGVRAENSVGTRTILDILNAEQELLNAQVQLVTARRDAYVAGFALLSAMGKAEARDLGLDGGPLYNPVANYDRYGGSWSDWRDGPRPEPVATRTVDTPAQTPVVTPTNDPTLQRPVDTTRPNPAGGGN